MDDVICAAFEFFGSLIPKNNRLMKRINRIRSRFLRNAVKVLLFLLAAAMIGGACFLISLMLNQ